MIRLSTPRKMAYLSCGTPKRKGDPVPYPNGVFISTTAGTFYAACVEDLVVPVSERLDSPQQARQLSLFEDVT